MSKIKIVGRYIGNGDTYVVEDKIFKRFIWTEADVSAETYNELIQGEKDGWFNFYEPVSKLELKQILANLSSGINKEFLLIEKRIDSLGEAEVEALSTRLDNLGINIYNDFQNLQEEVDDIKELGKITYDDTEVRNQISSLQSEMENTGKEITQIKAGIEQVSLQINEIRSKIITNISAVEGNLQLTTDSYQVVSLSSNTTLVLPNVTKPLDIIIEIKPSADITLTYPSNVRWQGDKPSIISGNIYEIYLGFDGTDWIGGWIVYEPVS